MDIRPVPARMSIGAGIAMSQELADQDRLTVRRNQTSPNLSKYSSNAKIVRNNCHVALIHSGGGRTTVLGRWNEDSLTGNVGGVAHLFCLNNAIEVGAARFRLKRPAMPLKFDKFRRRTDFCREVERLAVEAEQLTEFSIANAHRVFQDRRKDRLHVPWR